MTIYFKKEEICQAPELDGGTLLLRCVAGSQAYGMATPESDVDIRGIFVPTEKYHLGFLNRVEQIERKPETVIYALQKYMKLACDANPNICELLFIPEDCILDEHKLFAPLKECRKLFLSRKVRWTYTGYAAAQIHRIKKHRHYLLHPLEKKPEREDYGLPEGKKLISREQIGAFWVVLAHLLRDISEELPHLDDLYIDALEIIKSEGFPGWEGIVQKNPTGVLNEEALEQIKKLTGASDNFILALQLEQQYYRAVNEWSQYQNWKKARNPARAALERKWGFDTKHASHAIRLSRQGEEIMKTGNLQVRLEDADKIRAIRDGIWLDGSEITYDKVIDYVTNKELEMKKLYDSNECPLPHKPNRKVLDELCIEITRKANEMC